jgi:hypothetical protein
MTPGIYYVTFSAAATGNVGEGLAVFKDNKVNGGDIGYLYRGSYTISSNSITADLHIKRWNAAIHSVFGSFPEYHLRVRGTASADWGNFTVEGDMVEHPQFRISIKGRRLGDAA